MLVNEMLSAVPKEWKQKIKSLRQNIAFDIMNSNFQKATSQIKISKFIYSKMINDKIKFDPTALVAKWSADLNAVITSDDLFEAFKLIRITTLSPKHRDFQFRLLHRVLVTNRSLMLWNINDSENCTFCKAEPETICHLLWDCTHSNEIWNMLFDWIKTKTQIDMPYDKRETLFGITNYNMQFLNCLFFML